MTGSTLKRMALAALAVLAAGLVLVSTVAAHGADRHGKFGSHHLLKANLDGAQEVPGPGDPDGRAKALVKVKPSKGKVCFALRWRDIDVPTRAHIHAGKKGVAGPVVVPFFEGAPVKEGCVRNLDKTLLRAIRDNPRDYYVNIHNAKFPDGAVRGQLKHTGKHRGHFGDRKCDDRKHHGDDRGKHCDRGDDHGDRDDHCDRDDDHGDDDHGDDRKDRGDDRDKDCDRGDDHGDKDHGDKDDDHGDKDRGDKDDKDHGDKDRGDKDDKDHGDNDRGDKDDKDHGDKDRGKSCERGRGHIDKGHAKQDHGDDKHCDRGKDDGKGHGDDDRGKHDDGRDDH